MLCASIELTRLREANKNNRQLKNLENSLNLNLPPLSLPQSQTQPSQQQTVEEQNQSKKNQLNHTISNINLQQYNTHYAPHRHENTFRHPATQKIKHKATHFDDLVVNTENGYVRGRAFYADHHLELGYTQYGRKKYRVNAWLGIPYAEKPLGSLRFKRPVPVKNWNDILDATEMPNTCYQLPDTVISGFEGVEMWNPNTNISEDCLYLNIWTPHPRPKKAAVMVWIYGGGFTSGTSTLKVYDPKIFVSETQVIYISIQYRLSIFGYLYLDHEDAPGNQGLLDQYMALKWIHNNVQFFGGDNTKITIYGESAGSVSVSMHLLSRLSSNLFNNAIMESGTALADWATLKNSEAIKRGTEILETMGCKGNITDIIECAQKIEPKTALEKSDEHYFSKATHGIAQYTFVPVVDNYFLEDEPINLLNRGKFKKCPILTGVNKDEGNWFFVYSFPEYRNLTEGPVVDYENFKVFLTSLFHFYPQFPSTSSPAIQNAVLYRYTNWDNVHNLKKNFENLDDAAGDFHFVCPTVDFANIYAINDQPVYFYQFTQRNSRHFWPDWLGVMHGDEIAFVFGEPIHPANNYTEGERVLAKKMLKYWSNFAKYNNPNGPTSSSQEEILRANMFYKTQTLSQRIEEWPRYEIKFNIERDQQRAYLILDAKGISSNYNIRAEYCSFWGSFLPNLVLSECK
jgi:acetylcholinesterase